MINGLEGLMGGGKSYEAVRFHILPALKKGRKVITNLPLVMEAWEQMFPDLVHLIEIRTEAKPVLGSWDAEAANRGEMAFRVGEFVEADARKSETPKAPFSGVWCFYDTWRGEKGIGPLFVIDECHISFPRTRPSKGIDTPDEVVQFFKLSRHFGVDFLLATQRFKSVHEDVRDLIQIHHRVMKAIAFGEPNTYIKKTLNGFRGAEVNTSTRKYEGFYFSLYRSHTQGQQVQESDAADVSPFIKKFRRFTWAFCGVVAMVWVYALWPSDAQPESKQAKQFHQDIKQTPPGHYLEYSQQGQPVHVPPQQMAARHPPAKAKPEPQPEPEPKEAPKPDVGPMQGKTLHLSGSSLFKGETVYVFEVSAGAQRILTLTSNDLQEAGYKYQHLAHCMGMLQWKDSKAFPVVCDAPRLMSGVESKPVVITDSSRGLASSRHTAAPVETDYPHPLTAASKTERLVLSGAL